MTLLSESTKLEGSGGFTEYSGSGKLKNKKALITSGEYCKINILVNNASKQ
ncbi:hypothetical protein PENANT_c006G09299 [Penicillium antarcticum]|uniref:Uncharacterized protein n=1 Tax=Penicillium antarcticum TaxID=416450 RepID=A0A1V6QD07_9EURO|nr:hypothetical protein PENANT_c006G09299 [Penicillium antarcticum]